jgi:hypothetical protein
MWTPRERLCRDDIQSLEQLGATLPTEGALTVGLMARDVDIPRARTLH